MQRDSQTAPLTVFIMTMNSIRTIERTLESLAPLSCSVYVLDSGSTDGTVEYCRAHGAVVDHRDWNGPVEQRNHGLQHLAESPWILMLDSDESLGHELCESIRRVVEADDRSIVGWEMNRRVWLHGRPLRYTFQPEWRLRLVRGGVAEIVGVGVNGQGGHDRVIVHGRVKRLVGDCRHDSWENVSAMLDQYLYFARRAGRHQPKGGTAGRILLSPVMTFLKQYILKRGLLDGRAGLITAAAAAAGTTMKHLLIAERRLMERNEAPPPLDPHFRDDQSARPDIRSGSA